jgi:hypothetical protein
MATRSARGQLLAAVAALAGLAAGPAAAQSITHPDKTVASTKPATAKPAAKPKVAAKPSDQASTDYWAINTDLGKYSRDTPAERTIASRQPLRDTPGGTVGFTSGDIRNGTLADGSTAAGMERYNQDQKSYVGMSLSVTSRDKNFPLLPIVPRNSSW